MLDKLFDYIHTDTANVERIEKGRKNINRMVHICDYICIFFLVFSLFFYIIHYYYSAIFYGILACAYMVMGGYLMVKREIYSFMIYRRKKDE